MTNYWFHDEALLHMNFYDFTRCITSAIKKKPSPDNERMGIQKKYSLLPNHPLAKTHYLVQHSDDSCSQYGKQLVPRVIGTTIPCQNDKRSWMLFTLAHFKPFHVSFIDDTSCLEDIFRSYPFSDRSLSIMNNWEEIHKCEDERDHERLRKREAATSECVAMTNTLAHSGCESIVNDTDN